MDILTSEYPLVNVTQLSILISLGAENAFLNGIINYTYDKEGNTRIDILIIRYHHDGAIIQYRCKSGSQL